MKRGKREQQAVAPARRALWGSAMRRWLVIACTMFLAVPLGIVAFSIEVSLTGSFTGLYLLRGRRKPFEVRTDIFLDEEQRLLLALPIPWLSRLLIHRGPTAGRTPPYLEYTWEPASGDGFVISHLTGDKLLIVNWSRFLDDTGKAPSGLFLGGSLPFDYNPQAARSAQDTGMAYFDGKRWYHGWCSVNEMLALGSDPDRKFPPSAWQFIDSRVLDAGTDRLLITSRHQVYLESVPIRIRKWVLIRAGNLYFTMATRLENVGTSPASYYYVYGDEPWVGDYGRSLGNVGWTRQGLVHYEGFVDTAATDFVGFFDAGNSVIGERGPFTRAANYLQWLGAYPPTKAYFTNMAGPLRPPWNTVPLSAPRSRALFLQWGRVTMPPRGLRTYVVAIGMIPPTPDPGLPRKPVVVADPALLSQTIAPDAESRPVVPRAEPDGTQVLHKP